MSPSKSIVRGFGGGRFNPDTYDQEWMTERRLQWTTTSRSFLSTIQQFITYHEDHSIKMEITVMDSTFTTNGALKCDSVKMRMFQ